MLTSSSPEPQSGKSLDIVATRSAYHCGKCGDALEFEPLRHREIAIKPYILGWCNNGGYIDWNGVRRMVACERYAIRLRVPLERIHCALDSP